MIWYESGKEWENLKEEDKRKEEEQSETENNTNQKHSLTLLRQTGKASFNPNESGELRKVLNFNMPVKFFWGAIDSMHKTVTFSQVHSIAQGAKTLFFWKVLTMTKILVSFVLAT